MIFPKKIDFHMHTIVSDGTDTPDMLLDNIMAAGIDMFSVTDHDAISGCDQVRYLLRLAEYNGVENLPVFVNGVEFSCRDNYGKYHILGYAYNAAHPAIRNLVEEVHGLRMSKFARRIEFLEDQYGFDFPQEELDALWHLKNPGKPHIGNLLVKLGYAKDKNSAIKDYLNHVTYFGRSHIFPEEAVEAILAAGGIPVLAHPVYGDGGQRLDDREMHRRLEALTMAGLMGVEAFYSGFTKETTLKMLRLANDFDLLVSAGSDYHGTNKTVPLGHTNLVSVDAGGGRVKGFIRACFSRIH